MTDGNKTVAFAILLAVCFGGLMTCHGHRLEKAKSACEPTDLYAWPRGIKTQIYKCPEDTDGDIR